jgi:hypothetical protein
MVTEHRVNHFWGVHFEFDFVALNTASEFSVSQGGWLARELDRKFRRILIS